MKEFYERKLKDKSDEELRFIIDHPADMDEDAVAVSEMILAHREKEGKTVATRHFGKEVMADLNKQKLKQSFKFYTSGFGSQTLMAAIIPAVITLGTIHILFYFAKSESDMTWIAFLTFASGLPLGHLFYKVFLKHDHGYFGRLIQDYLYQISFLLLLTLELKVISVSSNMTFSIQGIWSSYFIIALITPFFEMGLSLLNGLLKLLRIHLW